VPPVTVFGAGAMGTALAIHLARKGERVTLWASEFDTRVLPSLVELRHHPALPERLPREVRVLGPDDLDRAGAAAAAAAPAANSAGARSLARMIARSLDRTEAVISVAKGLEPETRLRISEVYAEELGGPPVVAVGGPALAAEVSEGLPTVAVFAGPEPAALSLTSEIFSSSRYLVERTDDILGVELCATAKNVGAIALGILEGLGIQSEQGYKNARAAMFSRALDEMADLVDTYGGWRATALGMAGAGDLLVTSLGGRNRQYGEMIGAGADPRHALDDMEARGVTVEGAASSSDVQALAEEKGLELPVHRAVHRVLHEGFPPTSILEALS
jgi:glycerol-3-phosphate dehydrogenase (NAD(P)+)